MSNQSRHRSGSPIGGRYAATRRGDADLAVHLADPADGTGASSPQAGAVPGVPAAELNRRQRRALKELKELGAITPAGNVYEYDYGKHGDGYSMNTLEALVDAGLATMHFGPGMRRHYRPVQTDS